VAPFPALVAVLSQVRLTLIAPALFYILRHTQAQTSQPIHDGPDPMEHALHSSFSVASCGSLLPGGTLLNTPPRICRHMLPCGASTCTGKQIPTAQPVGTVQNPSPKASMQLFQHHRLFSNPAFSSAPSSPQHGTCTAADLLRSQGYGLSPPVSVGTQTPTIQHISFIPWKPVGQSLGHSTSSAHGGGTGSFRSRSFFVRSSVCNLPLHTRGGTSMSQLLEQHSCTHNMQHWIAKLQRSSRLSFWNDALVLLAIDIIT
jgi:hypothetical protein